MYINFLECIFHRMLETLCDEVRYSNSGYEYFWCRLCLVRKTRVLQVERLFKFAMKSEFPVIIHPNCILLWISSVQCPTSLFSF